MTDFHEATPILNVKNLQASMDYYVQKLGFKKRWDWGDPPEFGCVKRGKVEIFLCQGGQGQTRDVDVDLHGQRYALYESTRKAAPRS